MAKVGRPRIGDERRKVDLRRDQLDALRMIAALEGCSQATVIRKAIDREIRRHLKGGRAA